MWAGCGDAPGVVFVIVSNALILLPLHAILWAAGVSRRVIIEVGLAVIGLRLLGILCNALRAFWNNSAIMSVLPPPKGPRWQVDYLAALPGAEPRGALARAVPRASR